VHRCQPHEGLGIQMREIGQALAGILVEVPGVPQALAGHPPS
jgi:hypothetical protein